VSIVQGRTIHSILVDVFTTRAIQP
jgi:hypothetical protein